VLTELGCRNAAPEERTRRLADGNSLFLIVRPSGAKSWEYRWKDGGKIKNIVLGRYPEMGIAAARRARDIVKAQRHAGHDPLRARREARTERKAAQTAEIAAREAARHEARRSATTFEDVARRWHAEHEIGWTAKHGRQVLQSLEDHAFPSLGALPVDAVTPQQIMEALGPMVDAGALETAGRVKQRCSQIFDYAVLRNLARSNPVAVTKGEFTRRFAQARRRRPRENFPSIPPQEAGQFLRAMSDYTGQAGQLARLIALTACRTGEARYATWAEFDRDAAVWTIPAERMKARRDHRVPLSTQALALLRAIRAQRPTGELLFPHSTKAGKATSENAVLFMISQLGYKGRMTGHGFRSLFSTLANESGQWRPDVIEAALAHTEENDVRAAYNRTDYFEERRKLMQWWADEMDRLAEVPRQSHAVVDLADSTKLGLERISGEVEA
jgi:integrase